MELPLVNILHAIYPASEVPVSQKTIRLQQQLCHPLYSASNALQRIYKRVLHPLNITYPQYLVLMALWEKDGVNIQTISEATYFDSGTLTPLLQKLKIKKLIEIRPMKEDRRNKIVHLTKKGQRLHDKATKIPEMISCLAPFIDGTLGNFKKRIEDLYKALLEHELKMTSDD